MESAHGDELPELAVTLATLGQRRVGESLHRFGRLPTFEALVLVDWHNAYLLTYLQIAFHSGIIYRSKL